MGISLVLSRFGCFGLFCLPLGEGGVQYAMGCHSEKDFFAHAVHRSTPETVFHAGSTVINFFSKGGENLLTFPDICATCHRLPAGECGTKVSKIPNYQRIKKQE